MVSLSVYEFPKFCPWGTTLLQYSLHEPDPKDAPKAALFHFFLHFYHVLSEQTERFNIPVQAVCPKQKLEKLKVQEDADSLYYEARHLPEGASEIARCQLEIVEQYLQFLYTVGLLLQNESSENPRMDAPAFLHALSALTQKVLAVKRAHEDKDHRNPTFDFDGLWDLLGIGFQVDSDACLLRLDEPYRTMPSALKELSLRCSQDKKNGFYRFCRLDFSQEKIAVGLDGVLDLFSQKARPHLLEIREMLRGAPAARVQVKYRFVLGSVTEPQIYYIVNGKPLYVIYSTGNGASSFLPRHYLRWVLSPDDSRRFFDNPVNRECGVCDLAYQNLRRCRLSACSFDTGTWCKMNYRSELIRGDEHFFICGVETWSGLGVGEDDYTVILQYIQAVLRVLQRAE